MTSYSDRATKATRTRKLNAAANISDYAALLRCLLTAQNASDKAKSMAASRVNRRAWRGNSDSYAKSRKAVARAYAMKGRRWLRQLSCSRNWT